MDSKISPSLTEPLHSPPPERPLDNGAALMEMAILLPLLVLLMVGILEFGGAFKDFLTISNAVRDGTRVLSSQGNDMDADCNAILAAVDSMTIATRFDDLEEIQIYKANANGDQIPGLTNTYTFTGTDRTNCADWSVSPFPAPYPPLSRNTLVGNTPLDIVGMRIIYTHNWYTGLPPFSGFMTIDQSTITRLEPEGFAP